MVRLLIADDEEPERAALAELAKRYLGERLEWVGTAADGTAALELVSRHRPQVAILDIKMPGYSGLEVAGVLRTAVPESRIIILTAYGEFSFAQQAIQVGVTQYLLKPYSRSELVEVLGRAVAEADAVLRQQQREEQFRQATRMLAQRVLVEDLLQGRVLESERSEQCASLAGLQRLPNCVLVAEGSDQLDLIEQGVFRYLGDYHPLTHRLEHGRTVILVHRDANVVGERQILRAATDLARWCRAAGEVGIRISVGRVARTLGELYRSYADAVYALTRPNGNSQLAIVSQTGPTAGAPSSRAGSLRRLAHWLLAGTDPAYLLRWLEREIYRDPEPTGPDLMRRGFELMDACREGLLLVGILPDALSRMEYPLIRELQQVHNSVQFVTWAGRALLWYRGTLDQQRPANARQAVLEALTHMEEHYMERLDLTRVARTVGVSPAHFSRLFKQITGQGFNRRLIEIRLAAAADLLSRSAVSADLVSRLVGFRSYSYFCTLFRRRYGCSPSEFRARYVARNPRGTGGLGP